MLNISRGTINRPQRVVLYGGEGIGKTTLASQFPDPLFIDTESGSSHLDVKRIEGIGNWDALLSAVKEVAATPGICRTLVIDTADRAERMAAESVCRAYNINSIEAAGYGKGYTYLADTFDKLLKACDSVIASGKHVVIIAHAKMRKFEQPDEMGAYDRWEMKLSRTVAPMVKEWCDMLLFLNYETIVITTDDKKKKATGGKRVMYTTHRPTFDAKNRHGLTEKLPMEYAAIAKCFADAAQAPSAPSAPAAPAPAKLTDDRMAPATEKTLATLNKRMSDAGITEEQLQRAVAESGNFPPEMPIKQYPERFINNWIFKYWEKIIKMIDDSAELPF